MRLNFLLLLLLFCSNLFAQNHHTRFESIDVLHYSFEIHLNDSTDRIEGKTNVYIKFLKPSENFGLDLIESDGANKGMSVELVTFEKRPLNFTHEDNQLKIQLIKAAQTDEVLDFEITYSGVPTDGLVISKNKYGNRTFFGDNWPDRAKHWLPTVDHPSDKATLEFLVYAPGHFEVVSNGYLVKELNLKNNLKLTHWREDVTLSTKLMVIGVADFVVGNKEDYNNIPVSSWVFPQNKETGFENYKYGTKALQYFSELIGPYSYEKLAHVQSKTRYGGMENAGCIFYHENTAISDKSQERLFAHEVAHQWFGNSVTEQNWHHVWLSEGFATYLTHVYNQNFHGEDVFREGLKRDRVRIIKYAERKLSPIVDTTVTEYIRLLNANSYQKASWFLHMLRMDLGDELFFNGLRKYYADHQNSTALTDDFKNVMENVSGKELDLFFTQWLWQPGHPELKMDRKQKRGKNLILELKQTQPDYLFEFPLEIEIQYQNGDTEQKIIQVNEKETKVSIKTNSQVQEVIFDPNIKLLFEIENP